MITKQVAAYVASLGYRDIPQSTVASAKKLLLDGVGCLLTGTGNEPGRIASRSTARLAGSGGASTIIISGERASARDAAFVNGITLCSVGINDIHKPSGAHPGACVIPTVLAVGEWLASSGEDLIPAMIAGYDVMGRLGRAVIPSHRERGFHPTGTLGTFGAAAAAGKLLGLNQGQMTAAFGIAGSQAAGLKAYLEDGSLTMIFVAGRAAQNGIEASVLAQEGFSGPTTVFEHKFGFVKATSDHYRLEEIAADLGESFEADATSLRSHYGSSLTITATGAAAEVMRRNPARRAGDVAGITVRCNPIVVEEASNAAPQTMLAARLSTQFNIALMMVRGDLLLRDMTERDMHEPGIRSLLPLVEFETDAAMPRYGSIVTVRFKDGTEGRGEMLMPKGEPQNPMTWDDTAHKFLRLIEPLDDGRGAARIVELIHALEETKVATLVSAINAVARSAAQRASAAPQG